MNEAKQLIQILDWIANCSEIPVSDRYNLICHINKVGDIDEKAAEYLTKILKYLYQSSVSEARELRRKIKLLEFCQKNEQQKEISSRWALYRTCRTFLSGIVAKAVKISRDFIDSLYKNTEKVYKDKEAAEIAAIKKSL